MSENLMRHTSKMFSRYEPFLHFCHLKKFDSTDGIRDFYAMLEVVAVKQL
jgi:hypothetical protein